MKKCPYCAEEIQAEAIKCKHCQSLINKEVVETKEISKNWLVSRIFGKNKFWGSTTALVIGILILVSGLNNPQGQGSSIYAGLAIIFGSIAYKSAKKRKLKIVQDTSLRKTLEIIALILIVAGTVFQNNLIINWVNDPFPNVIIPIWIIIAYLVVIIKKQK